ncbi:beta strand repeat-containing protein [Kineococcus sp. SYSU DK004]|uniref:beta strand repeat-containing protein n=1 Tax=Kineococcus sp. SYSU DK004 TaxID=3383125 RepID=UPI003D7DEABF
MTAATSRLRRRGIGAGVAALVGLSGVGLTATAAFADENFAVERVQGADRFETAANIAAATFENGTTDAVLVNAYSPADALSAAAIAGEVGAAVLLTDAGTLNATTAEALADLGVENVWIVGGTAAVSAAQQTALEADYTVERFSGADRVGTSLDILSALSEVDDAPTSAYLVRAFGNPADALAAGPIAYANGVPILPVPGAVNAEWIAAVEDAGITSVTVLGGTAAVPAQVETDLRAAGFTVNTRISGASGQETAVAIANAAVANLGFSNEGVGIARGDIAANIQNSADALASAQWLGANQFPLLLTQSAGVLGAAAEGYLTDNAATLQAAAAFGGRAAIADTVITAAQDAGRDVPEAPAAFIVTDVTRVANGVLGYANPAAASQSDAAFTQADTFLVNGTTATVGAFAAAASLGDELTIERGANGTTYRLVDRAPADYTSGLVGNVNTTATTFDIIEPVTGVVLRGSIDYSGTYTAYTVNGTSATVTGFNAEINEGDTVTISGTGASLSAPRTIALTNQTVSGTVGARTAANSFTIITAAGATLGDDPASAANTAFVVSSTDRLTVDGAAATLSQFDGALSAGDRVTYARSGGVATVALTNSAPTPVIGVLPEGQTASSLALYVGNSGTLTSPTVDVTTGYTLIVDGRVATLAEFEAALTAGDRVTIQAPDAPSNTAGSVSVTNQSLTGNVVGVNVGATTLDVQNAGANALLADDLDYSDATFYAGNTTAAYFVNGETRTLPQFSAALSNIANGTQTGTIQVVDNGTTTEFRLATAANTARAQLAAVNGQAPGAVATVTLTFNRPVYFTGSPATGDFNVSVLTAPNTTTTASGQSTGAPTTAATASTTITVDVAGDPVAIAGPLSVALTAQGAAKFLDVTGTAATPSSVTATISS